MKLETQFSKAALSDLKLIYQNSKEQWGNDRAREYMNSLYDFFEKISLFPNIGSSCHEFYPNSKSLPCQKHVIFFIPKENAILIGRVLHERMNPSNFISSKDFKPNSYLGE